MWVEAARKYIPGSDNWSDEKVDEVRNKRSALFERKLTYKIYQAASNWSPLKRPGYPEDVARVVAFLCSKDGEWVNAQVLQLGGGVAM